MAVLSSQGRKGFAKKVLDYITGLNLANLYSLEVGDANIPSVEFYKKPDSKCFAVFRADIQRKAELIIFV